MHIPNLIRIYTMHVQHRHSYTLAPTHTHDIYEMFKDLKLKTTEASIING